MQYYVVRASLSSPGAWLTLHTCSNVFMYGPFANVWLLVCLTETMQSHKTFLNTHSHLCGRNSFTDWIWVVVTSARRASDSERASEREHAKLLDTSVPSVSRCSNQALWLHRFRLGSGDVAMSTSSSSKKKLLPASTSQSHHHRIHKKPPAYLPRSGYADDSDFEYY